MGEDVLNVAIMQYWVYSIKENNEVILLDDGVSLHLNNTSYKKYLNEIYSERPGYEVVPDEYERTHGEAIVVRISESLNGRLEMDNTIRLSQVEFNNLIEYNEITTD